MLTQDLFFLVLDFAAFILTGLLIALTIQIMQVLQDVRRIAQNLEQITALVERLAQVSVPGLEHLAKGANRIERKLVNMVEKKVDDLTQTV